MKVTLFSIVCSCLFSLPVLAHKPSLVDTSQSPYSDIYMVALDDVAWTEGFWAERFDVLQHKMIPYMWELFQDDEASHAWSNFLIAAGMGNGIDNEFAGPSFNDGDFLKWFESVVNVYAVTKDPELDALMDRIIEVVGKAQREDGYLHTKNIIPERTGHKQRKQFEDRDHFETYNMGHLITTACLHYRATGKDSMLTLAIKAADYIDKVCREDPEGLALNAICPSHYMGIMELYRTTGVERYRDLGKKMISIRSLVPESVGSDHNQDRIPFEEMSEAVGHAVRANYLYAGVADVVAETGDPSYMHALQCIAEDVWSQKLYITGMTGALYDGASPDASSDHFAIKLVHQAYGRDYQLPNLTAYNESCATIGYNLWNWRMFTLTKDVHYIDLFEQTLYNGVLPGISLDGKKYFYANPLKKLDDFNWPMRWPITRAGNIPESFCCPPNVLRTIAEVQNYAYALGENVLYVNLYGSNSLETEWNDGDCVKISQQTNYPWEGSVKITIESAPKSNKIIQLRIPEWVDPKNTSVAINGKRFSTELEPGTYCKLERNWSDGDVIELHLGFEVAIYEANPLVEENLNQVAVKYGPLVYCVEAVDLPEGVDIQDLRIAPDFKKDEIEFIKESVEGSEIQFIQIPAYAVVNESWDDSTLYRKRAVSEMKPISLKLIPYYAWDNRGDCEMTIWIPLATNY